jgi:hypothetical protein
MSDIDLDVDEFEEQEHFNFIFQDFYSPEEKHDQDGKNDSGG